MKKKKKLNSLQKRLKVLLLEIAGFLLFTAVSIFSVVYDNNQGWTAENTIAVIYAFMTPTLGMTFYFPFSKYLIGTDKKIIHQKLKLNQKLDALYDCGRLTDIENEYIDDENLERLNEINGILKSCNANYSEISLDDIDKHFDKWNHFVDDDIKLKFLDRINVRRLYKRIKENRSDAFDILYCSYKNGNLVEEPKFPLLEMFLPLVVSLEGLFVAIYQVLEVGGVLQNTLFDYLKVFGSFVLLSGFFAIFSTSSERKNQFKEYRRTMDNLCEIDKRVEQKNND